MNANTRIRVLRADYAEPKHAADIIYLLNQYALHPMGGGRELDAKVKKDLVAQLAVLPHALSVLAYLDNDPLGLANCFLGFSTFACKPLLNIHDIFVLESFRGRSVGQHILNTLEEIARELGCCNITLEVLRENFAAQGAYRKFGFAPYELDPQAGPAQFWQKSL